MNSTKMKPVWKTCVVEGVPSDLGDLVLYTDGVTGEVDKDFHCSDNGAVFRPRHLDSDFDPRYEWSITAYQTTRTKAAKYRRVECGYCSGVGKLPPVGWKGYFTECYNCNGKGHNLEKI